MLKMTQHDITSGASYTTGFVGFVSGLTFGQWLSLIGALVMIGTFFVNLYYRRHEKQLAQAEHARKEERHRAEMIKIQQSFRRDSRKDDLA